MVACLDGCDTRNGRPLVFPGEGKTRIRRLGDSLIFSLKGENLIVRKGAPRDVPQRTDDQYHADADNENFVANPEEPHAVFEIGLSEVLVNNDKVSVIALAGMV